MLLGCSGNRERGGVREKTGFRWFDVGNERETEKGVCIPIVCVCAAMCVFLFLVVVVTFSLVG